MKCPGQADLELRGRRERRKWVYFQSDENVLTIGYGDDCTALNTLNH